MNIIILLNFIAIIAILIKKACASKLGLAGIF